VKWWLLCIGIALTGLGCASQGNVLYDFDGDGSLDENDCDSADPLVFPGAPDDWGDPLQPPALTSPSITHR